MNHDNIELNQYILVETCIICLDELGPLNNWSCQQCNVQIHQECIRNNIQNTCPHCRFELPAASPECPTHLSSATQLGITNDYNCNYILKMLVLCGACGIYGLFAGGCVYFILPAFFEGVSPYNGSIQLKY